MTLTSISKLTPTEFENLTYDLLQLSGMKSLLWRTPGADGGRDIEGVMPTMDFSGYYKQEKWYVECKKYSSSIDWPTLWKKISYADSKNADFLLLVTNNNPSPQCENEIANWNSGKRNVTVRVWRGYELSKIIYNYPIIMSKYGLIKDKISIELSLHPILFEIMKISQSSYVAAELGQNTDRYIELSAALAELVSSKMDDLKVHGKLVSGISLSKNIDYTWLRWNGPIGNWDETGIRAFLAMARHLVCATAITVEAEISNLTINYKKQKCTITDGGYKILKLIATISNIELSDASDNSINLSLRVL